MCAKLDWHQADRGYPFIDKPSILAGAKMQAVVDPARQDKIIDGATPTFKQCWQTGWDVWQKFELNGPTCLPLSLDCTCSHLPAASDVADFYPNKVAATQFALDGKVKQRTIAQAPTVIPAFHACRLVAVLSASGKSMIILR